MVLTLRDSAASECRGGARRRPLFAADRPRRRQRRWRRIVAPSPWCWRLWRTRTQADLVGISGSASRQLLRPTDPWTTCRQGVLRALVTGGSIVVVVGDNDEALRSIAADERALMPDIAS